MAIRCATALLLAALLWSRACAAEPIVWLDRGVDLQGRSSFFVPAVRDETGKKFDFEPAVLVTAGLQEQLKASGLEVLEVAAIGDFIKVDSALVDYQAGSALGRWALPGAGGTWCVVRSILVDGASGRVLGEIISSQTVSSGGLFSLGAEKSLPRGAGEEIAKAIEALVRKP